MNLIYLHQNEKSSNPPTSEKSLKEAFFLLNQMEKKRSKKNLVHSHRNPLLPTEEERAQSSFHSQEKRQTIQAIQHSLLLAEQIIYSLPPSFLKEAPFLSMIQQRSFSLENLQNFKERKNWKIHTTLEMIQELRGKTEHFSFTALQKRNKNMDAAFSPEEENILLLAYEKNIVRMLYYLCKNTMLYWQINKYYFFFVEKLDIFTRNLYFNKLKQWMNFDIFKASYKYNEIEKYLWKPSDSLLDEKQETSQTSLFAESLQSLQAHFLRQWKSQSEKEKVKMTNIGSYSPIAYVFKRLSQSYSFLVHSEMNEKQPKNLFWYKSQPWRYVLVEFLCDILAQWKMLHITEYWILHSLQIYDSMMKEMSEFLKILQYANLSSQGKILQDFHHGRITRHSKYPQSKNITADFLFRETHKLCYVPKNIQEASERMKQLLEFHTMNKILLDFILSPAPQKASTSLTKTSEIKVPNHLPQTRDQIQKLCFLHYYSHSLTELQNDIKSMEYLSKISKSLKYTIAQDHIRLVMSVAKNAKYRTIDMSDLLQEGMLGLTKAVERFQLDRGYQFTTYATWWVHQALNRVTMNHNQMIPVPTHIQRKIHLILTTSAQLGKKLKREPFLEEIAQELKLPVQKIYQFLETSAISRKMISLDQKFRMGDNRTYGNFLQTQQLHFPIHLSSVFGSILSFVSAKEATLLKMRLGIYPFKRHTIEQIARIFSISREKIKSIEKASYEKIQSQLEHLSSSSTLFDFLVKSMTTF